MNVATTTRMPDRRGATYPQIVLASLWIACAYRDQALDPKDFVRAASKRHTAARSPVA
ncbi:hypothetical protein [Burkholderia sp. BE12]|uniref:hypothetical protein n=1 Tax=Burkholderia sp. BE12 TaxID=2082394 RepID=UPI00131A1637|nr:hypothetical protein [Burkholderia sp. BE12]